MTDQIEGVWVRTGPTPDGQQYIATVEVGQDLSIGLTRDSAPRYAAALLACCQRAEHDCAVYHQLTGLDVGEEEAITLIGELRADRPDLDRQATAPLEFAPGVSARDRRPFLIVAMYGDSIGQWELADAREHAGMVLEAVEAADLDHAYQQLLDRSPGMDPDVTRAAVADLAAHRYIPKP